MGKHPGLTVLAGTAMAVAIGICTASFELAIQLREPDLGLKGGGRLVVIRIWDRRTSQLRPPFLDEFLTLRGKLESVQQLSGYRDVERNLVIPGGSAGPVSVAQITSSGMRLAGVAPELGRLIGEDDEQVGAPAVAVVGHEQWRTGFGADPGILER